MTSLLDLNDNLLIKIFQDCSPQHLSTLATTCSKLKRITRTIFKDYQKTNSINIKISTSLSNPSDVANIKRDLNTLRNFGDLITELVVDFHVDENYASKVNTAIINLLGKYCYGGPLEQLNLNFCNHLDHNAIVDGAMLLRRIKFLHLRECDRTTGPLLANAEHVERLEIIGSDCADYLSHHLPNLKSFSWHYQKSQQDEDHNCTLESDHIALVDFLRRHDDLEEMSLLSFDSTPHIESINLKKLNIRCREISPMKLPNLQSLTIRAMYVAEQDLITFLTNCGSADSLLELHLFLGDLKIDEEIVRCLTGFKQLEVLHFGAESTFDGLHLPYLYQLSKLRELQFWCVTFFTDDLLAEIVSKMEQLESIEILLPTEIENDLTSSTHQHISDICRMRNKTLRLNMGVYGAKKLVAITIGKE